MNSIVIDQVSEIRFFRPKINAKIGPFITPLFAIFGDYPMLYRAFGAFHYSTPNQFFLVKK